MSISLSGNVLGIYIFKMGCPNSSKIQRLASQLFLGGDPRPWPLRMDVIWECTEMPLCDNITKVQNGSGSAFAHSTPVFQLRSPALFWKSVLLFSRFINFFLFFVDSVIRVHEHTNFLFKAFCLDKSHIQKVSEPMAFSDVCSGPSPGVTIFPFL